MGCHGGGLCSDLNEFNVPEKEQGELLALVGPTKSDIVTAKEETEETKE